MLLFHGTRKTFDKFDLAFYGTGEAGVCVGFYFTDNLKGAYQHATRYAPRSGEPLVYVCEVNEPALTLSIWKPISKHNHEVQQHWESLPAAQYWAKESKDWFGDLFRMLPFGNPDPQPSESEKYAFLQKRGFQVMYDTEGAGTDAYLCGTSIVVLDENIIDIVEVLPAEQLLYEMSGDAQQYELGDTQQELGKTGVMSFLRRLTDLERS